MGGMMTKTMIRLLAALSFVAAAVPAEAATLLDMGAPSMSSWRTVSRYPGAGQRVEVSIDTTLTQMGFWLGLEASDSVKFVIFDSTNTNLLFSMTNSFGGYDGALRLWLSSPFDFMLTAGSVYYIGYVASIDHLMGYSYPADTSQNGLTARYGIANYRDFVAPYAAAPGGSDLNLMLYGYQGAAPDTGPDAPGAVPEPATWAMMVGGFGLLGAAMRRRRRTVVTFA